LAGWVPSLLLLQRCKAIPKTISFKRLLKAFPRFFLQRCKAISIAFKKLLLTPLGQSLLLTILLVRLPLSLANLASSKRGRLWLILSQCLLPRIPPLFLLAQELFRPPR
jgi:hypothetical protein